MKKIVHFIYRNLPQGLQTHLVKKIVTVPTDIDKSIIVKLADTAEEFREAFRLLHDAYLEQGFIEKSPNGMRVIPQYALPTTSTIVIKKNDEVIGTLSIVKDNIIGIPMEEDFNLEMLKKKYPAKIAEITALVIKKEYRRQEGTNALFPLLKYMYEYCVNYFNVEMVTVVIHPKDKVFYKSLMFFQEIDGTKEINYMNAPAVALQLDLKYAYDNFKKHYLGEMASKDLFTFFVNAKFSNLQFPDRKYFTSSDRVISKNIFKEFFLEECGVFDSLSFSNFQKVRILFHPTHLKNSLESYATQLPAVRMHERFEVNMQCKMIEMNSVGQVLDLSRNGIRLISKIPLTLNISYEILIKISPMREIQLKCLPITFDGSCYGVLIVEHSNEYMSFIDELENYTLKLVDAA